MRSRLYLLILLLSCFIQNLHAQEKLFSNDGVFTAAPKNIITKGTKLKLNRSVLSALYKNKAAEVLIEIPVESETLILHLKKKNLFAKNFEVIVSATLEICPYTPGYYLQGKIEGETSSFAAISIFEDFVAGIISYKGINYDLAIGNNINDHTDDSYVIYADKDNSTARPQCFTKDANALTGINKNASLSSSFVGCPIDIYFETGYRLFYNLNTVQNVMNYFTILFNGEQALYNNESIVVQIRQVKVWTTADPEEAYTDMYSCLGSFAGRMDISGFNGDIAQYITVNVLGGGAAFRDNLCTTFFGKSSVCGDLAYNYAPYPNYSFSVSVMAHETGHTIGSPHTHSCTWPGGPIDNCVAVDEGPCAPGPAPVAGGTIMSYCHLTSYGINFANGFGPLPGDLLRAKVADAVATGCTCNCNNIQLDIIRQNINCNNASGGATAIISGGTGTFSYLWSNGSTGASVSGLAAGTHYVTVFGSNSACKVVKGFKILDSSVTVSLNPSNSPVTKCVNQSYSISATISPVWWPYSYQWFKNGLAIPGAAALSLTVSSAINETASYYLIATGGVCALQSPITTVKFVDIPVPVVNVNGSAAVCTGQSTQLSIPATTFFTEWQLNGVPIAGAANPVLSVSSAGSYRVRNYFPASGGCSVLSAAVNITSIPLPDASLNATSISICYGENATIIHPASSGETYLWYRNSIIIPGETTNSIVVSTGGNYYLKVQGANGCYNSSPVAIVTVNPLPVAVLSPADTVALCKGGVLAISATVLNMAEYTWYHEAEQLTISFSNILNITEAGSYHVKITNTITGCTNSSEETFVTTYEPPAIVASNDSIIAMGQPYQLHVQGVTAVEVDHFEWIPATGLNDPGSNHPTTILTHDQEYLVKAFYPSGCFATDKVLIRVLKGPAFYIPSAFSPNSDTKNDLLKCIAIGMKSFKRFDIYNRYGQRIFHTTDLSQGWDGKYNGNLVSIGTYIYLAEGVDFSGKNVIAKGAVTIFY